MQNESAIIRINKVWRGGENYNPLHSKSGFDSTSSINSRISSKSGPGAKAEADAIAYVKKKGITKSPSKETNFFVQSFDIHTKFCSSPNSVTCRNNAKLTHSEQQHGIQKRAPSSKMKMKSKSR